MQRRLLCIFCRRQQTTESMSEGPKVKGHLIITVAEASGKNKDDQLVWDPNFVEGFVKSESEAPFPIVGTVTAATTF